MLEALNITSTDLEMIMRLSAAMFLGGAIGVEREKHGKEAGFRTYALVCLGSALIMIVSTHVFEIYKDIATVDPSRIAAQVVTGVGFLGAGAIIRYSDKVTGLTTAAGVWTVAGIGLACGIGEYKPAIFTTILALMILMIFSKVNRFLHNGDS